VKAVNLQKMSIQDLHIGFNQQSSTFGPFSYGRQAGKPTLDFVVSKNDEKKQKVRSVESMFDGWTWKNKVSSGFSRLRFSGSDIDTGNQDEAITTLARLLDARFVDMEFGQNQIERIPPREIQNSIDFYSLFVPTDRRFDEDVFEWFADQSQSYDNVEFLFKFESQSDEEKIHQIVNDYRIYDSNVYLYPTGRRVDTASPRYEDAMKVANRQTWNVSPRIGLLASAQEDFVDDE
jgi:hypothetical protein